MTKTNIDKMKKIISESLLISAEDIKEDDLISGLKNIDSLSFEMIVVAMETACGREINSIDLMSVKTVGDLTKLLEGAG